MGAEDEVFRMPPMTSPLIRRISARRYRGARCLRPDGECARSQAARFRQPRDGKP
jgi:hypothetical protein